MRGALSGRRALVAGGAGELGREAVRSFLEAGAIVHVPLRHAEQGAGLLDFIGGERPELHLHGGVDLSVGEEVEALTGAIREAAGEDPGILLNLAGGFSMDPVEDTSPDQWEALWSANATTAFLCARALFPGMKAAGWGRIVNVAALPALERGEAGLSAYGAAKAALLNLTHTLAKEGVAHGITSNAIVPSILDTIENRKTMPGADRTKWLPTAEVAAFLRFLASDEARLINGAAIPLTLD
jgi:NAD(P)-dependent dehydrogenase (short-subunit alcohol dehydrogenase family)